MKPRLTIVKPPPKKKFDVGTVIRVVVGVVIIAGSLLLAMKCERDLAKKRLRAFKECVQTGMEPMKCSFKIAFNPGEN